MTTAEAERGFWGHDPEAPLDLGSLGLDAAASITARLADGSMRALTDTIASVGACSRPVRLIGHADTLDGATGELVESFRSADQPLGALFKPCGNRRAEVCVSCSRIYARDVFELISTGVQGGKGVPASVKHSAVLFVTLTAPSFGPVHGVREDGRPCHPRSRAGVCAHGRPLVCWTRHHEGDDELGVPLCADCYDIETAVIWQWFCPELWRRFTIALRRGLAARLGVSASRLPEQMRLEYAKVAEVQARGTAHFHALIRLDGPGGQGSPAPLGADVLADAVRAAAFSVAVAAPPVDERDAPRVLRFGAQTDIKTVRHGVIPGDEVSAEQVAAYLAKYSTKSAGIDPSQPRPHLYALSRACCTLARRALAGCENGCAEYAADRHPALCADCRDNPYALLGHWSSMLGFRGHFSTKSRHYSVTLTALRRARRRFQRWTADALRHRHTLDTRDLEARLMADADEDETTLIVGHWTYAGTGWPRAGDKALADAAAARAREYAQWKAQQAA